MSPLFKIALYLITVLAAAVLLSPPFYWLFQALSEAGLFKGFDGFPFHRYFTRIAQVAALVLLWPLVRSLHIRRLSDLGIERNPQFWRDLAVGFGIAMGFMILLGVGYFFQEVYRLRPEWNGTKLLRVAASAAVVGTIEEFLFRGVILGLAVKAMGAMRGLTLSAVVFAGVHFLRPARGSAETVTWTSGLDQLFSFVAAAPPFPLLAAGVASLLVAGVILAAATLGTRSLALAIGIHAAWVFGQQSLSVIGRFRVRPEDALLPWVGPNLVSGAVATGLVPLGALALTGIAVFLYLKYVPRSSLAEVRA